LGTRKWDNTNSYNSPMCHLFSYSGTANCSSRSSKYANTITNFFFLTETYLVLAKRVSNVCYRVHEPYIVKMIHFERKKCLNPFDADLILRNFN